MKLIAQMVKVSATEVAEFDMLETLPDTFIRIQFRGVSRETLQVNFLRPSFASRLFSHLAGLQWASVQSLSRHALVARLIGFWGIQSNLLSSRERLLNFGLTIEPTK
jgi:hypothetical protein